MPRSKLEPWGFFLAHVLRNGRYSKNCENFFKNIIVFCPLPRAKVKKIRFFIEKCLFYCSSFYIQLLDCHAIYHLKELFKRKRMTYYLSIYVLFYLVKLLNFKHFPCFATCREDRNG